MIDRAMVLAAGLGKRMRPLTDTLPKPLVPVAGKALIDHVLDKLADAGVTQAVVNVHHRADQIEAHVKGRARPRIVISDERGELLDTGGGIVKALPHLGDAPFFHMNSDTVWIEGVTPNLTRLAAQFDAARMDILLLLASTATSIGYDGRGDFNMAPDGRLSRRAGAPGRALRLCGRRDPQSRDLRRCAGRRVLAQPPVRQRRRRRTPPWTASRRHLDACRHARGDQGGGGGHFGERGVGSRTPLSFRPSECEAGS